jgi:hypothetical protein
VSKSSKLQTGLTIVVPISPTNYDLKNIGVWLSEIETVNSIKKVLLIFDNFDIENQEIFNNFLRKEISSNKLSTLNCNYGNPGEVRNYGMNECETSHVVFWDSDDIPNVKGIDNFDFENQKDDIFIFGFSIKTEWNNEIRNYQPNIFGLVRNLGIWRMIFSMRFIDSTNIRFPNFKLGEDQVFFSDLASLNPSIKFIKKNLYVYIKSSRYHLTTDPKIRSELWKAKSLLRKIYKRNHKLLSFMIYMRVFVTCFKLKVIGVFSANN